MAAHHACNLTKRVIVAHGYEVVPVHHGARVQLLATEQHWIAYTRLEPSCLQRTCARSFPAASRMPRMARCKRQAVSVGSIASGGVRQAGFATARKCISHVNETELQRTIVSRNLASPGFRNQELEWFREVESIRRNSHSPSLCCCLCSLPSPPTRSVCPPILSLRTTPSSWDPTIHQHLAVSSSLFQPCFPDRIWIQETSVDIVDVRLFLLYFKVSPSPNGAQS